MKKKLFKTLLILLSLTVVLSCNKDIDDVIQEDSPFNYNRVQSPEGVYLELDHLGQKTILARDEEGITINGWNGGQLLDGAYFRLLRLFNDYGTVAIRANMPKTQTWGSFNLFDTHGFNTNKLQLQQSSSLTGPHWEIYFDGVSSRETFPDNGSGDITFKENYFSSSTNLTYAIAGEVDVAFTDKAGNPATLKGIFWRK